MRKDINITKISCDGCGLELKADTNLVEIIDTDLCPDCASTLLRLLIKEHKLNLTDIKSILEEETEFILRRRRGIVSTNPHFEII